MLIWLALACKEPPDPVDSADSADTAPEVLRGALSFALPLAEPEAFDQVVGVDHDPEVHEGIEELLCTDYAGRGFPWCYDEHDGSDYLLEGSWDRMDAGSVAVLAAASGEVVDLDDGNYDRCHGDLGTGGVSCDGHPRRANYVIIEHAGGVRSRYWHLKTDSVAVTIGQQVACGEVLGLVGSSGNSSQPHLHFEVEGADGVVIDPYAGPWSQPETWWAEQNDPEALPGTTCVD
ncbi:MAG: M23 family metallopeptidase [Alphaproteobacteria bacterium]|nr:M23 family metallopeptidase [Alphaproteobacteria bacterium]